MDFKITDEMIETMKAGDHSKFETVFLAYFKNVKTFVSRLIKSDYDAEEISQELFVKLWINRDKIDASKNFNNFIYISARNAALNYMKSEKVRGNYTIEMVNDDEETYCIEEEYYAKETSLLIDLIVSQMPAQRQRIYNLSRNGGKSNDEISLMLNISKRTVETHLNRALKELKEVVKAALTFII